MADPTVDPSTPPYTPAHLRRALDELRGSGVGGTDDNDAADLFAGRYRILQTVGEGGMGVVYRAEQQHPARVVALKVIKPGRLSDGLLRRFEHEVEVLGRLQHPGIAQIFDAGTVQTEHGPQPFFAMELIDGQPIDQHLTHRKPHLRDRLELLLRICDAVHHAHQRGVIHRDLKPANILVTSDGQPKVLDFGVARATDSDLTVAQTMETEPGQLVGTLQYMSPEQAIGDLRQLDIRSDVYALGVIAYEMLAERLPYELKDRALPDAVQVIRDQEPQRLSSVNGNLRGDLETIVGKALQKEKERRYSSVAEFASDVRRYLNYEPISARPPSTWYQLSRFARRNKALVGGVAATFVVLVAGVIVSTAGFVGEARQRAIAETERQRTSDEAAKQRAVSDFLTHMLNAADPKRMLGDQVTVLQATEQAIKRLDEGVLQDQPAIEAAVRNAIGITLTSLSRYKEAEQVLRKALELDRRTLPPLHPHIATVLGSLADVLRSRGDADQAEQLLREALSINRQSLPANHPDLAKSASNLATVLQMRGQLDQAEPLFRESLHIHELAQPRNEPDIATGMMNLAALLRAQGRLGEAEPLYRKALELRRRALPAEHPEISASLNSLGLLLQDQQKLDVAEPLHRESLEIARKSYPAGHPSIATSLNSLAALLYEQGRFADAEPLFREALEIQRTSYPALHPSIATGLNNLAMVVRAQGKLGEAESLLRESLEINRKSLPTGHSAIATSLNNLGLVLRAQGKLLESEPFFRDALEMYRKSLPGEHPTVALSLHNLGRVLRELHRPADSEPLLREALRIRRTRLGLRVNSTTQTATELASALDALDRAQEANAIRMEFGVPTSRPSGPATNP
jgi:tetratricopeptide (TPR) repeat protein